MGRDVGEGPERESYGERWGGGAEREREREREPYIKHYDFTNNGGCCGVNMPFRPLNPYLRFTFSPLILSWHHSEEYK